ncbi:NINE protein [Persicobacter psychrovividus]|uniref:NINE protein n=1 Tax=Persicobacter psychrovividus TaxID=387638 RepID=A0ABM7VI25_9BACT|nr:hypothetical protein PEPS_26630 [Persicobacter psychrovividus]
MKDKLIAALLAFFLGALGIQHFYLKRPTHYGILSIVFCWTYIPALIGLIDGIQLLIMNDREFADKYNGGVQNIGFNYQQAHQQHARPVTSTNVADELRKLHELKECGILTEQEFSEQKRKLLRK